MPIKFDVTNRFTGAVQFTAKIDCDEAAAYSVKLGLAVKWAVKADAKLAGANLAGADLAYANLADADLTGAKLAGAYLADANLAGAYLAGADLAYADLTGAKLAGAYLADANLAGAKWRYGITISKAPIQIYGLHWPVHIIDTHMQIGCELHSHDEWAGFDDRRILEMEGRTAMKFWRAHKAALMALCASHAVKAEAEPEAA